MASATTPRFSNSKQLAALALPIALTQLAQVALTTTDTLMMGLIGTEALAAGGLAVVLFNQLRTMGVGLITAVGNQVAATQARVEVAADGAGNTTDDPEPIRDIVRASFAIATVAGILGAIIIVALGHALVWFGQDPAVLDLAQPMLLTLAVGLVPCLWFQVIRQFTVGMRRPKALIWITVGSIAVNAGLNWVLISGAWGLPRFGLPGIGLATSLVYLLSFLVFYAVVRRDPVLAPLLSLRGWKSSGATVRKLVKLGIPISATYGSEAGFFSVVAVLMGTFGPAALAAHTVVNQLVYITFQISVGLSHGASILISRELAQHNTTAAARIARTALGHGAIVMALVAALYLAAPNLVLRPFLDVSNPAEQAGFAIAAGLLVVAAGMQFVDCAQNIGVGLLRGLDDTKSGFRLSLVGYWAVGLPAAWLLGWLAGAGPIGAWLGLAAGLATTAVLLLRRFQSSLNKLHAVPRTQE
ncbi:MATE family efflux transporter [Saccharopolyspora pogona]|uniref:MATE family efflux transporter n=1 Tax=Saccharopolyspora pogona TaxID=333966 RepID=UPI0016828332|nr:MATE family efflux transporter [Saccharopolyspora pogona]